MKAICLFVGGRADGEWHEVDTSHATWAVSVWINFTVDSTGPEPTSAVYPGAETYRRVDFHSGPYDKLSVYQPADERDDPLGLLRKILRGYQK